VTGSLKFKYYIFEEQCFTTFFTYHEFFNFNCLKLTASKVLGYMLVWGAFFVKMPQILKIITNKSIAGISFSSCALELFMNSLMIGYNIYRDNPFSIYGENVFLGLSNIIIIGLFFRYPIIKDFNIYWITSVLIFISSSLLILQLVPDWVQESSITLAVVVFVIARFKQIKVNHINKSTGNLAMLTVLMNFGGNIARMFTVMVETSNDPLFVLSNAIPIVVNGYLFLQFFLYWNNPMPKVEEKKH